MRKIQMYTPVRHYHEKKDMYTQNINSVLEHGIFINGPEIKDLEKCLAKYVGVKHAIGVSSGTDALLITLLAVGVKAGDEVITTPFTWISTASVIKLLGAKPVFCEIDVNTFNIDSKSLRRNITSRTKAIEGYLAQHPNASAIEIGKFLGISRQRVYFYLHQMKGSPGSKIQSPQLLTKRELEILSYLVKEYTNKQIAEAMGVSWRTVKNEVAYILVKTKTKNRSQAVEVAIEKGLIP